MSSVESQAVQFRSSWIGIDTLSVSASAFKNSPDQPDYDSYRSAFRLGQLLQCDRFCAK